MQYHKRIVFLNIHILVSGVAGVIVGLKTAGEIFVLVSELYNILGPADTRIDEINSKLTELHASVDQIQGDIGSILNRLHHLTNLIAYHDDYSRLKNYLRQYTRYQDRDMEVEQSWLNTVLSHGPYGLDHTIENFDSFISGSSLSTSVLLSYESVLIEKHSRDSNLYYAKLVEFVDYILALQVSGYAMYVAARKLKNQPVRLHSTETGGATIFSRRHGSRVEGTMAWWQLGFASKQVWVPS